MSLICLTTLPVPQGYLLLYVSRESESGFIKCLKYRQVLFFSFVFLSVPKHSGRYLNKQLDHLQV